MYNEGCRMVEPCSALARKGHTQHWTSLLFNTAKKPVFSLSLSCVFKKIPALCSASVSLGFWLSTILLS